LSPQLRTLQQVVVGVQYPVMTPQQAVQVSTLWLRQEAAEAAVVAKTPLQAAVVAVAAVLSFQQHLETTPQQGVAVAVVIPQPAVVVMVLNH
jgi:hypothetical protein